MIRHIDGLLGCVTPTEIMRAIACGLRVVEFFSSSAYGGKGLRQAAPKGAVKRSADRI